MSMALTRRFFLKGLIAAPAIVAVSNLMPLRGQAFGLWIRYQTWPIGSDRPAEMVILDRSERYRPTTLGHGSGVAREEHFRNMIEPEWARTYDEIYTETIFKPSNVSVERFISKNADMLPSGQRYQNLESIIEYKEEIAMRNRMPLAEITHRYQKRNSPYESDWT